MYVCMYIYIYIYIYICMYMCVHIQMYRGIGGKYNSHIDLETWQKIQVLAENTGLCVFTHMYVHRDLYFT